MIFKADLELFVRFFQYPRNSRSFRCLDILIPKKLNIWYSDIIWYPSIRKSLSDEFKMNFGWMEIQYPINCLYNYFAIRKSLSDEWGVISELVRCTRGRGISRSLLNIFNKEFTSGFFLNINKNYLLNIFNKEFTSWFLTINKNILLFNNS